MPSDEAAEPWERVSEEAAQLRAPLKIVAPALWNFETPREELAQPLALAQLVSNLEVAPEVGLEQPSTSEQPP